MYFCGIECKAAWQRTQKPVTKEWLKDAYVTQGLDTTQIGHLVHRDPKSVWNWLKDFDIETRKRGTTNNWRYSIGAPRFLTDAGRKRLSDCARAARLKDGRKPYLKNGIHWLKHPGARPPSWKGGITPERQALYASQEWRDIVKLVWKRDKCRCKRCEKNLSHRRGKVAIHHIESFANRARRTELANLVLLCRTCHLWIHSRKNVNKDFLEGI